MGFEFRFRQYATALYHALKTDAFYMTMEQSVSPGNGTSKEAMLRYMEFSMTEARKYGELYIPKGHAYGVSIWSKPMDPSLALRKHTEKTDFLRDQMGEISLATYCAIVDFMSSKSENIVDKNFWYLSIVGVLPQYQGKGFGAQLIKQVLKKTDGLNVPTFLETFTPENMGFYHRLGFQSVKSVHEPTTRSTYWIMVREPPAQ